MPCVSSEAERWHQCALYDRAHGVKECEAVERKQEEMDLCEGETLKEIMTGEIKVKMGDDAMVEI